MLKSYKLAHTKDVRKMISEGQYDAEMLDPLISGIIGINVFAVYGYKPR